MCISENQWKQKTVRKQKNISDTEDAGRWELCRAHPAASRPSGVSKAGWWKQRLFRNDTICQQHMVFVQVVCIS